MVSDLGGEAGLDNLEKEANKRAKAANPDASKSKKDSENVDSDEEEGDVHLSLSANYCSDPDLVRKHLDSGVLAKLVRIPWVSYPLQSAEGRHNGCK